MMQKFKQNLKYFPFLMRGIGGLFFILIFFVMLFSACDDDDNLPEPMSIKIISPQANETINQDTYLVEIDAQTNHTNTDIKQVKLYVDEELVFTDTEAPWQFEWDTSALENNAQYTLYAVGYDTRNNRSTSSEITIKYSQPLIFTVSITSPTENEILEDDVVSVFANINTNTGGTVTATLHVDDQLVDTRPYDPATQDWHLEWNTSTYEDSTDYTLRVEISDDLGHQAASTPVHVCLRCNERPLYVNINSPVADETVQGVVTVNVNAISTIDAEINWGVLMVGEAPVDTLTTSPWQFLWDTTAFTDSLNYDLQVIMHDDAGNEAASPVVMVYLCCNEEPFSSDRVVVQELFTGAWCTPCKLYADPAADVLAEEFGPEQFVTIHYHIKAGLYDPFEIPACVNRQSFYGLDNSLPHSVFDGTLVVSGGDSNTEETYRQTIEERLDIESPIGIRLSGSLAEEMVTARIKAFEPISSSQIKVRFVLLESNVPLSTLHFNFVVRDMLPDELITLQNEGDLVEVERSFLIDEEWDIENMQLVVFVQDDDSHEILQAQAF